LSQAAGVQSLVCMGFYFLRERLRFESRAQRAAPRKA